jgi:DNA-directed RNA polymerase specialized sigma subunit
MTSLASFDQFRREVFSRPRVDWEEIDQLVWKARAGDEAAREGIIERCLPYVVWLAWHYKPFLPHEDYGDIVGIGNLALVTCLNDALAARNPVVYLMRCAYYQVLEYVARRTSLISVPKTGKAKPVISLEATPALQNSLSDNPVQTTGAADAYQAWLTEALKVLTPLQREVVLVKYGFPERSCDSLYQLSRAQGKSGRYTSSLKAALRKLREYAVKSRFTEENEQLA